MFASTFLSLKAAVGLLAAVVAYIAFIMNVTPAIPTKNLIEALLAVLVFSFFQMVLTWQKDHIERDRRLRLEALNEDLRISEHKSQEANKLKTEFMAVTTHELKTPLNSILGFTDLMLNGMGVEGPDLSADQRALLERVRVKSKDLLSSINDILDMSRLEAQKIEVVLEPYHPAAVIRQLVKDATPQVTEKGVEIKAMIAPDIPETALGDVHLLSRIVSNLISNAIKFTERGTIGVEATLEGPFHWQISISDTGVGIPPDKLETIFQPFRQVDGSTTRQYGGTGLGLAIARSNAKLLGGDITVQSEVGVGSIFTVTLPLVRVTPEEVALAKHQ